MKLKSRRGIVIIVLLLVVGAIAFAIQRSRTGPEILAEVDLEDGRILRVEGVTYGTKHTIGNESLLIKHFGPWLPTALRDALAPDPPRSTAEMDDPSLVVWVHAVSKTNGAYVDCQGLRIEFAAKDGDLYGQYSSAWTGFNKFWRVGHFYSAWPRNERTLKTRIITWKDLKSFEVTLPNPGYQEPQTWTGEKPPLRKSVGEYQIELAALARQTNGGPDEYWKTKSVFWKPTFRILQEGREAAGWKFEHTSEDSMGNRGEYLGAHQPVLKFTATAWPSETNLNTPVVLARLPVFDLANPSNVWNLKVNEKIEVLGVFPAGVYVFSEGEYLPNPPIQMRAVGGGAPSGWTGRSRRISPTRVESFNGHYTDAPVIYVKAKDLPEKSRIGIRLVDAEGKLWQGRPEEQGAPHGVYAFMLRGVKNVAKAELVLLKPLEAEFMVKTGD